MLEYEGVKFDKGGRCNLQQFLYIPKGRIPKGRNDEL
jgi:hypothetical protein